MAGTTLGAPTALLSVPFPAVLSTRARRYHGVFAIGDQVLSVFSSRRKGDFEPVIVTLGEGSLQLHGRLSTLDARGVAQALVAAAASSEREGRSHG